MQGFLQYGVPSGPEKLLTLMNKVIKLFYWVQVQLRASCLTLTDVPSNNSSWLIGLSAN